MNVDPLQLDIKSHVSIIELNVCVCAATDSMDTKGLCMRERVGDLGVDDFDCITTDASDAAMRAGEADRAWGLLSAPKYRILMRSPSIFVWCDPWLVQVAS